MEKNKSLAAIFPDSWGLLWQDVINEADSIQEIRLRIDCPIIVKKGGEECYINSQGHFCTLEEARRISMVELKLLIQHLCKNSLYAFEDEIRRGYITVRGGHRIGICGQVIPDELGRVKTIKNITFLNIRIAHEIKGIGEKYLDDIYANGQIKNTLIISPPGMGKTTLLRDLIRLISQGNRCGRGMAVALVDERSEIAGCYQGVPQNDLGIRCDVMDGCEKAAGLMMILRSMAPRVIAIDEIGDEEEIKILKQAVYGGCRLLATVHGGSKEEIEAKYGDFISYFENFIVINNRDVNI